MSTIPTPAPKKQFICSHCQRSFGRLEHLKRHERSHRNEKPFQCPLCQSTFVRRDMLKRHLRNVHKDVNTDELVIKPDSFKDGSKTPSAKVGKAAASVRSKDVRANVLENLSKKGITLQPLPLPTVAPFVQGANSNANVLQISAIDKQQLPVTTPLSTTPLTTTSSDSDSDSSSGPAYFQFITSSAISGNRQLEDLQLHVSPFLHYMNLSNVYENLSSDIKSLINIKSPNFIEILINFTLESLICGNYEDLLTILIKLNELPLDLSHLLLVNSIVNNNSGSGMFNAAAAASSQESSLGSLDCLIRANCQTLINRLQNLVGLPQLQLQQQQQQHSCDELAALAEVYKLVSYYKLNHGSLFNFELKYRYFVENSQRIFSKLDLHGLLLNIKQKLLGCLDNLQDKQAEILMLTLANELSYHVVIQDDSLILQSLAQLQSRRSHSHSNSHSSSGFQSTLTKVLNSEFPHFSKILESLTFDNELLWKCHFNLICDPNEPSRLSKNSVTNHTTKDIFESLCVSIIIQLLACKSSLDGSQLRQIQRFKPMISTCLTELITRLKMGATYFEGQFPLLNKILTLFLSNSYFHLRFIVNLKNGVTFSSNEFMKPSSVTIPESLHAVLVQAKNPPKPKSLKVAKDPNYIHKSINPPTLSNVNLPSLGTILPRSILTNSPPQYDFKLTRSHSLNSSTMIVPSSQADLHIYQQLNSSSSSSSLSPRPMDRSSSSSTVQINYNHLWNKFQVNL